MRYARPLSAALLAGSLACSSRQAVPVDFISTTAPATVQVFDGHRVVDLDQPKVSDDSVRGRVNGAEVAIPIRKVQGITAVRFSGARTAMLIGGVAAVGALMGYALASNEGSEMTECDYNNFNMLSDLCWINR